MASSVQALVHTVLGTGSATMYTAPTGTYVQITKLLLVNVAGSSVTATVALVSSAVSYTTTQAQGLLAGQSWNSPNEYGLVLNPGDSITALASAATSVNFLMAGLLLT